MELNSAKSVSDPAAAVLKSYLEPFDRWFSDASVEGIACNSPGEVFISRGGSFAHELAPELTLIKLEGIARLLANLTPESRWPENPLLSATLPGGQRVQFFGAAACEPGPVAFSIRCPRFRTFSLSELHELGAFSGGLGRDSEGRTKDAFGPLDDAEIAIRFPPTDGPLVRRRVRNSTKPHPAIEAALLSGSVPELLKAFVEARRNIAVIGATNSGKTSLTNALLAEVPQHERIITIENAREIRINHPNRLHLFGSGEGEYLKASRMLAAVLRAEPHRIMLGELRDVEAYTFLQAINTGHPGSITTLHADSCDSAAMRIAEMAAPAAPHLDAAQLREMVEAFVDVFIHTVRSGANRGVAEIAFI